MNNNIDKLTKMAAGAAAIATNSAEILKEKTIEAIELSYFKEKYVTREEYNQLRQLVLKLQKEITKNDTTS